MNVKNLSFVLQGGADYKITEVISATPVILYMLQGKAHEFSIGAIGFYHMKDTKYDILGGLNYRWKDALVLQVGMQYEQHIIKFSYDINTSYLNDYTNGRGAFEFSLLLAGQKGKPLFNPKFGRSKTVNKTL